MGEKFGVNFDHEHVEGFEAMQDSGVADSYSEAARRAATAGLEELGYANGADHTPLSIAAREMGKWFAVFGMAFLAFTLFWPVEVRMWVVFFLGAAVTCYGLAELIDSSNWSVLRSRDGEKA